MLFQDSPTILTAGDFLMRMECNMTGSTYLLVLRDGEPLLFSHEKSFVFLLDALKGQGRASFANFVAFIADLVGLRYRQLPVDQHHHWSSPANYSIEDIYVFEEM
jgi:hypothetical protein